MFQAPTTMRPTGVVAEENEDGITESTTNFQKIEIKIGKELTDHILSQVDTGNIGKAAAEEFAFALHTAVGGKFKNSQSEVNFVYDRRSLKTIIADWYEKEAHSFTDNEVLGRIKDAMKSSGIPWLVSEQYRIEQAPNSQQ